MNCGYCNHACVKAGKQKSGVQKFLCLTCRKYQQARYKRNAWRSRVLEQIAALLREGLSMRGIARILRISLSTVLKKIRKIAAGIARPARWASRHIYEIDELWTFVGKKENEAWITYSIDRASKEVIDYHVGPRTSLSLRQVTDPLLASNPRRVCTDGLNSYRSLIPASIHRVGLFHTRRIERYNLNLRTHLKRLNRKTICFSKSKEMLEACLRIYFWGKSGGIFAI